MWELNLGKRALRAKNLTVGLAALALLAACFVAYRLTPQSQEAAVSAPPAEAQTASQAGLEPLARFVSEREQIRNQEIAQLNELISDRGTSETVRSDAQAQKLNLVTWMEQEVTLEGVLRARGFDEVVATVHQDSVNILIRTQQLTQSETARILELVTRETGQIGGNVKIIPVN